MLKLRVRIHVPIMVLVVIVLLGGLWAALIRIGWQLPNIASAAGYHGALMISGFLGTLVSLERATVLKRKWAYAGPLLSGLGALTLLIGLPSEIGRAALVISAAILCAVFVLFLRIRSTIDILTMSLGAVMWLIGNALWLLGEPIYHAVPWWAGFLILTIAGERLELSRVLMHRPRSKTIFRISIGLFAIGLLTSLLNFDLGLRVSGAGLIMVGGWLIRFDVARYTIRQTGLTRYIAACLLPGYVWLAIGGGLWLIFGGTSTAGYQYDAMLHTLFLGFVFSMIFGHAPIIIPSVMPVDFTYRSIFYLHLVLLQLSLIVRIAADLFAAQPIRMWAGLINVIAVLLFLGVMIRSIHRRSVTA
jgi:hypothetical protein